MNEIYEKAIKPILPSKFDENELFSILITIIVLIFIYYITVKKRELSYLEMICIALLNLQMTTVGDYFLAMPPYDFYDTVDKNSGELTDLFLQNIVYPGVLLVFMHYYKKLIPSKLLFILMGTFFLTILESISVYFFNLFKYKTWTIYYSMLFYLIVMVLNVVFFEKVSTYLRSRREQIIENRGKNPF